MSYFTTNLSLDAAGQYHSCHHSHPGAPVHLTVRPSAYCLSHLDMHLDRCGVILNQNKKKQKKIYVSLSGIKGTSADTYLNAFTRLFWLNVNVTLFDNSKLYTVALHLVLLTVLQDDASN